MGRKIPIKINFRSDGINRVDVLSGRSSDHQETRTRIHIHSFLLRADPVTLDDPTTIRDRRNNWNAAVLCT